jgi:hypothetical protein
MKGWIYLKASRGWLFQLTIGPTQLIMKKLIRSILLALVFTFTLTISSRAEENSNVETNFVAMLKNATLKGTWAPVQKAQLGEAKGDDSYRISMVVKKEGNNWLVYSLFNYQGKEIEFPIPAVVKFAGDTAVLILDNVRAGQGNANWSARVLFHDNVYAGRWWETSNKEHGGTIAGTITQAK